MRRKIDDRHVVLVGAMGSGKTTIGSRVADALGRPFLDNDLGLRDLTGETAAETVARLGTKVLHDRERRVILGFLAHSTRSVISAAASVVDDEDVRKRLRERAVVVWLKGDPEVLAKRAERSAHRPFLDDGDCRVELARDRAGIFEQIADLVVDIVGFTVDDVVTQTLEALDQPT